MSTLGKKIPGVGVAAIMAAGMLVGTAAASDLNVNPGLWEFRTVMSTEGPMDMPEQRSQETECLTQEDIDQGPLFDMDDMGDGCEVLDSNISSNRVTYTMACDAGDGSTFDTEYSMDLMGDRIEGVMTGDINTPMGDMKLRMDFEGERVGDSC
ncbi:hypothetical protein J2T57_004295 [Natronocella acetinitrilica]|jgi:hypothetical protein|uniref:DUF3617 family protein n=1 Tax=Natronocella acetinitrilica TaxID=414046 RepID=A0AAE3KDQ0_9GAMM|nr:DUF3617 family protein [Natronocella acetinitrilica]MCP1677121.1 hypothetical protein [Natronocella acetinitrilica]